ncbi:MAG TPA: sigma-70 family RNA polymerase sigma factor [Acidobacteriota bacterium]|nr:sigma-70 family RNA polymerase sigma factor [Acidobacteriota bacterium]
MDKDQDSTDIRRVLDGDLSAFENIVRRWQGPLINLAFRFCRNRQRAEELAQDAFLQIFRKLPKFRGDAAFSTWMFSLALNLYRSDLRRRALAADSLDGLADLAGGRQPYAEFARRERAELVRRAVAALPERYRDAVIVFYFVEMNLSETARLLGIREGTAKALLYRGRELLRHKLGESDVAPAMFGGVPHEDG